MDNENTVAEVCPYCGAEVKMAWNIERDGYKAFCPHCGMLLMLCDECSHSDEDVTGRCDYDFDTGVCRFNSEGENSGVESQLALLHRDGYLAAEQIIRDLQHKVLAMSACAERKELCE